MIVLLSAVFRFRPAAPGTELGSKFDAKTNPSWTSPVSRAAGKSKTASRPFALGREAEVFPPHAEIQRELRADPPVLGDERVHVRHPVVARRLAVGERRVGDLARPVAVRRVAVADGQEVEPAPEVVAAVLSLPEVAVQMVAAQLAAGADRMLPLAQRHRVADRVGRLQVVDARAVGRRAEPDAAADVTVAADRRAG